MFKEIQIYCSGDEVCFDDIQKSERPTVVVNTEHIVSISEIRTWGFCTGNEDFPYRVIRMSTGERILCVPESANELVRLLEESRENNTDAFIEYLRKWVASHNENDYYTFGYIISTHLDDFIDNFKNYIKGE